MFVHSGTHAVHRNYPPIVLSLAIFFAALGILVLAILLYFAGIP